MPTINVFQDPIRYLAPDGTYQPVDLTLVDTAEGWECNTFETPCTISELGEIALKVNEDTFQYKLTGWGYDTPESINEFTEPIVASQDDVNIVSFTDLVPNTKVEYYLYSCGIKENIYLSECPVIPEGVSDLVLEYLIEGDLNDPQLEGDGSLVFSSNTGGFGVKWTPAQIIDNNVNILIPQYEVSGRNVYFKIPVGWLQGASYPVIIDPTSNPVYANTPNECAGGTAQAIFMKFNLPTIPSLGTVSSVLLNNSETGGSYEGSTWSRTVSYWTLNSATWTSTSDAATLNGVKTSSYNTGTTRTFSCDGSNFNVYGAFSDEIKGVSSNPACPLYYYSNGQNGNVMMAVIMYYTNVTTATNFSASTTVSFPYRGGLFDIYQIYAPASTNAARPNLTITYTTSAPVRVIQQYQRMRRN